MKLLLFRHLWGVDEPWETFFPKAKKAGYHGIETWVPEPKERGRFRKLLRQNGLSFLAYIGTGGSSVEEHARSFEQALETARGMEPLAVNAHSGRDAFSLDESRAFFERALAAESSSGLRVSHETHRGRILYNPWTTSALVDEFPELKLNYDLSHWVCVAERLLDTEGAILKKCAKRCVHIHARVGYEEGPQVPDPRAPEYAGHLKKHEDWWDEAWRAQKALGRDHVTLTPEFGPPWYLHTLPYTQVPVADLHDICEWQAQRQARRFKKLFGA